jgi:hypothetical protein
MALWSRAGRREGAYFRAAQAYMLISMPTGTSTIFGVFQVIREPPSRRHGCRIKYGSYTGSGASLQLLPSFKLHEFEEVLTEAANVRSGCAP